MKQNNYTRLYTGTKFYPLDPRVEDIHIADISHALACNNRFNGHLPRPYYVGQHSIVVSNNCSPKNALWGLLHDAYEAYLPDIPSPVKHDPRFRFYRNAEARGMLAVCERYGLDPVEPPEVKVADKRAYLAEIRDLRGREITATGHIKGEVWYKDLLPLEEKVIPWPWQKVEREFTNLFLRLTGRTNS